MKIPCFLAALLLTNVFAMKSSNSPRMRLNAADKGPIQKSIKSYIKSLESTAEISSSSTVDTTEQQYSKPDTMIRSRQIITNRDGGIYNIYFRKRLKRDL